MSRIEHALGTMVLALPDTSDHFFLFPHSLRHDADTVYPGTGVIKRITLETQAPDIFADLQVHDLINYAGNRFKLTRANGTVTAVQPVTAVPPYAAPHYQAFGHFTADTVFGVFATTFNADTLRKRVTPRESWIDDTAAAGPFYPTKNMVFECEIPCVGGMCVYLATSNNVVANTKKVTIEYEPWKSGKTRRNDEASNRPSVYR